MGRPDVTKAVQGEEFQRFVSLLEEYPNFWSKVPRIAPSQAMQQALLVDSPMRLYWPEDC